MLGGAKEGNATDTRIADRLASLWEKRPKKKFSKHAGSRNHV